LVTDAITNEHHQLDGVKLRGWAFSIVSDLYICEIMDFTLVPYAFQANNNATLTMTPPSNVKFTSLKQPVSQLPQLPQPQMVPPTHTINIVPIPLYNPHAAYGVLPP
jgi:hypothetical protein